MLSSKRLLATSCLLFLALTDRGVAQVRASELGTVSQIVDGTKLTVTYSRPRSRGRDKIFGTKIVSWGEVWTPGANTATTLEVSKDVQLNGQAIPKGKYSMWFVVRERGDWTLALDTNATRFHENRPDTLKVAYRFPVQVKEGPFLDVLTWDFPEIRNDGGVLAFAWGPKRVRIDVKVQPTLRVPLSAAEAEPFVGRYTIVRQRTPDKPRDFIVEFARDTLKGHWDTKVVDDGMQGLVVDYMGTFAMIKVAPDWFVPGLFDEKGIIYEVLRPEMLFEFNRENGRVQSFEIRNAKDVVWAKATRKQ